MTDNELINLANKYADEHWDDVCSHNGIKFGFIAGYRQGEKGKVDLEKVREWLRIHRTDWDETAEGDKKFDEEFMKAMEECK